MKHKALLVAAAWLMLGGCALFQPPSEDPMLARVEQLERRLENLERVLENQSLVNLAQQVDSLERRSDQHPHRWRQDRLSHSFRPRRAFSSLAALRDRYGKIRNAGRVATHDVVG